MKLTKRVIIALTLAGVVAASVPAIGLQSTQTEAKLTTTKTNGGGKTPNGSANGVPSQTCNSGGNCPGGHNK
jgi:hypothetical protein